MLSALRLLALAGETSNMMMTMAMMAMMAMLAMMATMMMMNLQACAGLRAGQGRRKSWMSH